MHAERFEAGGAALATIRAARSAGGRIVAVGTTSARVLESVTIDEEVASVRGETDLFIYPPHRWRNVDVLLTNFHLPRSTLLALVMAFAGIEPVRAAYREAVAREYRFYSYGDAMLIL
jgi:S-adenosylmethionine:tRNA ribosyltransferase-isomerase